jgi:hypothetical protein
MSTDSSREASIGSVREKRSKQRKEKHQNVRKWLRVDELDMVNDTNGYQSSSTTSESSSDEYLRKKDRFKSKRRAKKRKQEESQSTSTSGSTSQEGREKKKRGKRRRKQADESRTDEEKNGQSFYTPASPMYDSSEAAAEHAPQFNPEPEVVNISSEDNVTIH